MGRKSNEELESEALSVDGAANEIKAAAITEARKAAAGFYEAAQLVGRIQGVALVEHFSKTAKTKLLSDIKDTKGYKGLTIPTANGDVKIETWDEFCRIALGYSPDKIDGDIKGLHLFGEEFLEHSQKLGLGYRDLKKLSRLPDEVRTEIISDAMTGKDKDELIDLIEEMSVKHSAEKDRLKKKAVDLEERMEKVQETTKHQLDAKDKVLLQKAKTLLEREQKISELEAQLSGANPKEREDRFTAMQQEGVSDITNQVMNLLYELDMLMQEIQEREAYPDVLIEHVAQQTNRILERVIGITEKHHLVQDGIVIENDTDEFLSAMADTRE